MKRTLDHWKDQFSEKKYVFNAFEVIWQIKLVFLKNKGFWISKSKIVAKDNH